MRVHSEPSAAPIRPRAVGRSGTRAEADADRAARATRDGGNARVTPLPAEATRPVSAEQAALVLATLSRPATALPDEIARRFGAAYGHDLGAVRVHSGRDAATAAAAVGARAFTVGADVVLGAGESLPSAASPVLAHELAHVAQQQHGAADVLLCYPEAANGRSPAALLDFFEDAMDQNFFGRISETLAEISRQPGGFAYILEVFQKIDDDWEDNVGAALTERLGEASLDRLAADSVGLEALDLIYAGIITGDVTAFQRKQANRLLYARARRTGAADYLAQAGAANVKVFPLRFMRLTDLSENYATPTAKLLPNGRIRVDYPMKTWQSDWFKAEKRSLGARFFLGNGDELSRGEIVGVKNYESGEPVYYVPAIVLVDLANQAHNSTIGKIVDVSLVAASFGLGGAAAGGGRVANALRRADQVATEIGAAAFVIEEQRHYLIKRFPVAGPKLVRYAEAAKSAAAIYGVARLGQAGVSLMRDMHRATDAARREVPGGLTAGDAVLLDKLDNQSAALIKQIDAEEAAKAAAAKKTAPSADKPTTSIEAVEEAGARLETVKAPAKGDKTRAVARDEEKFKRQAREDRDAVLDDRGGDRSKDKKRSTTRDADREAARSTHRGLEAQASNEAMQLYRQARSGAFTHLHDADKRKLVEKFERLMEQAGWSHNKRNPLKGNFDEALRKPSSAPGQPQYKAGGPRVEPQDRRGTARPDYDAAARGGTTRRHYNLKADNLDRLTMAEAVGRAERYADKAVENARALPGNDPQIVLRYGNRPLDDFGASTAIEEAMNAIHFRAGSPIVEVHYGTFAYRRPSP